MPKVPGPEDQRWEKSKLMVDDSFSEWDELAKKSREAYRNAIKSKDYNSHKQPQKKYPPNRSTSQITSNDDNTEEILKTLGSSPVTLQCFSIHDCNFKCFQSPPPRASLEQHALPRKLDIRNNLGFLAQ